MKKLTQNQFIILGYVVLSIIALLWATLWETQFPGDTFKWSTQLKSNALVYGAVHGIFNVITIISWLAIVIVLSSEWASPGILKDYYRKRKTIITIITIRKKKRLWLLKKKNLLIIVNF